MKFTTASLFLLGNAHGFLSSSPAVFGVRSNQALSSTLVAEHKIDTISDTDPEPSTAVRAPLKWLGPYPALALRFPDLATSSQRERDAIGISLDFVLDTAANTNTINAQVSAELGLEVVGAALPGVGAGGAMDGGKTYLLGECELEGLSKEEEPFTFMTGLTASALPMASPASAGLLSLAFLQSFQGGVEFAWGQAEDGKITEMPSVTFHGDNDSIDDSLQRATITRVPVTQLPTVMVKVNGVEMPALLDTGSPVTVLNARAAKAAGIETIDVPSMDEQQNPFTKIANNFKIAQAAGRGDILQLASSNGQPVNLLKSKDQIDVAVVGVDDEISFGASNIFVGDLPGLAALNGIGVDSPPAVVLGMDVIRKRSKMLLRAQQDEVYF